MHTGDFFGSDQMTDITSLVFLANRTTAFRIEGSLSGQVFWLSKINFTGSDEGYAPTRVMGRGNAIKGINSGFDDRNQVFRVADAQQMSRFGLVQMRDDPADDFNHFGSILAQITAQAITVKI